MTTTPTVITTSDGRRNPTATAWFDRALPYLTPEQCCRVPGELAQLAAAGRRVTVSQWAEVLYWRLRYGQSFAEALDALWRQAGGRERP